MFTQVLCSADCRSFSAAQQLTMRCGLVPSSTLFASFPPNFTKRQSVIYRFSTQYLSVTNDFQDRVSVSRHLFLFFLVAVNIFWIK